MEQKSLRVMETNKTFFAKISSTITKMLIPTKLSINSMMISIKRNNLIKSYFNYTDFVEDDDSDKKESLLQKYEDSYSLYLEAIDKYIIDSVYRKVKNGTASQFEKETLSKYYMVVSLKEKQYVEYKYKKQDYLLKIDYESVSALKKESVIDKYNKFYVTKMDSLYKGLLKNYSIQLSDSTSSTNENTDKIYDKIFSTLESYISEILPVKLRISNKEDYKNILDDYEKYESMLIGKLDERDKIKQKTVLLGLSRELFTHSLPLSAAEQCYRKLIDDVKFMIIKTKEKPKKDRIFDIYIDILEEYNSKLLSTKVYWDKPEKREEFKVFWNKYKNIIKVNDPIEKQKLFLKNELKETSDILFKKEIKQKLVEIGGIKEIKNSCKTIKGNYKKVKVYNK